MTYSYKSDLSYSVYTSSVAHEPITTASPCGSSLTLSQQEPLATLDPSPPNCGSYLFVGGRTLRSYVDGEWWSCMCLGFRSWDLSVGAAGKEGRTSNRRAFYDVVVWFSHNLTASLPHILAQTRFSLFIKP